MTSALRVACVQVTPNEDRAANVAAAVAAIREASSKGAQLVALPEYVAQLHTSGKIMRAGAGVEETDDALQAFRAVAEECKCWVLVGSLTIRADADRIFNRSYLISADGHIVASYDKLHMFDATLPNGRTIRESAMYEPGSQAVVAASPWGSLGLTICYDLRFPQLYRALAQAGARLIFVPSAFTRPTGTLHWHALLRARAIENGCYIVAPATCGTSPESHPTFGHSLVVDPSGACVVEGGDEPGIFFADIDLAQADLARGRLPSLTHDRPITVKVLGATSPQDFS